MDPLNCFAIEAAMTRFGPAFLLAITVLGKSVADDPAQGGKSEPSPDAKIQIKLQTTTLRDSKKATERAKAAEALGALGASGMTARRDLCQAMMDSAPDVRTAAADALKKIDEPMYKLATAIYIKTDDIAIIHAEQQGVNAEPLTPLIIKVANNALDSVTAPAPKPAASEMRELHKKVLEADNIYRLCLSALCEIAKSDPAASKLIIGGLSYQIPVSGHADSRIRKDCETMSIFTRHFTIGCVRKLANVKPAIKPLQNVVNSDTTENRIAAIEALAAVANNDNKSAVKKALESHRSDKDPSVRQAIDAALTRLKEK